MKKTLFITLMAILLASGTQAQVQAAFGLKGGLNLAKVDVNADAVSNYENRTGFHGGGFVLVKLTKIGIQPEILFSRQGSKLNINTKSYDLTYDYINIPVMLKLYLAAGLNLQMGPQFGLLRDAVGTAITSTGDPLEVSKDTFKKSDLSFAIGAGWDLPFGLVIEGRYNLGLSKIQDNPNLDATKNQVVQVSLGYKLFKLGN